MKLSSVFLDSGHEVRAGWKFVLYGIVVLLLFFLTALAAVGLVSLVYPGLDAVPTSDVRWLGLNAIVLLVPSIGGLLFMARFVDRAPPAKFGVSMHDRWFRDFGIGVAVSGVMLGVVLAGSFLLGEVRMEWSLTASSVPTMVLTIAILAISAANEELLFRGYPLQVLVRSLTPWGAMLLISSVFGLLHAGNPGATAAGVTNTILAGVMLSLAYFKGRSLWLPYGIHIGWNAGLGVLLGFPMSGLHMASVFETDVSGSQDILGGSYGPEGGLLGTVVFGVTALAVHRLRSVRVSPQVASALEGRREEA